MATFLVLKPPGVRAGPDSVRFVRDGFSWPALVFPFIWMLFHRMWLYAVIFLMIDMGLAFATETLGYRLAGTVVLLALNLLVALESGELRLRHLAGKGWTVDAVISADNLDEAEEIYFASADLPAPPPVAAPSRDPWPRASAAPALGLFDTPRGR